MACQMALLVVVGVLVLSASALVFPTLSMRMKNVPGRSQRQEHSALSMTPREVKYKSRSEIPMIMKEFKSKKTYNVPGYVKGDYDQIKAVFREHSVQGEMTYESFLDSRKHAAEVIWSDITDSTDPSDPESPMRLDQLPTLLLRLDEVADETEMEMEQERLAWELEEIKHNFLDKYFESAARERVLSFTDFITWESVQAEIWYNRGLSENIIADIWEGIAGCVSRGVDKDTFLRIYKIVCGVTFLA